MSVTLGQLALALSARVLPAAKEVKYLVRQSDIQIPHEEQIKDNNIRKKTYHFEYEPNRRSFFGRARLMDRLVATFWTTTQPRRKMAPRSTLGKPVLCGRFENKTYTKQNVYYCTNVLLYKVEILYSFTCT